MKTIGFQLKSNEAIIVVLDQDENGVVFLTEESIKLKVDDHLKSEEISQFRNQVFSLFDNLKPNSIGIIVRNSKGKGIHAPSPISFKLEGIIQLYDKLEVDLIWPKSLDAFVKKNPVPVKAKHNYQESALNLAYYLLENGKK